MTVTKGARKRKGCWVCGDRFRRDHGEPTALKNTCVPCRGDRAILQGLDTGRLVLVVDGAFVPKSRERGISEPGFGGAGLVLVELGETDVILCRRSCGFAAESSTDAEMQAALRGQRWMPGVPIETDAQSLVARASGWQVTVRFVHWRDRRDAFDVADELAVAGRERYEASVQPVVPSVDAAFSSTLSSCDACADGCSDADCYRCYSPLRPENLRTLAKNLGHAAALCAAWRSRDGSWSPGCRLPSAAWERSR